MLKNADYGDTGAPLLAKMVILQQYVLQLTEIVKIAILPPNVLQILDMLKIEKNTLLLQSLKLYSLMFEGTFRKNRVVGVMIPLFDL
jgi:hypothetical protein